MDTHEVSYLWKTTSFKIDGEIWTKKTYFL
jgi:hypothetical protein